MPLPCLQRRKVASILTPHYPSSVEVAFSLPPGHPSTAQSKPQPQNIHTSIAVPVPRFSFPHLTFPSPCRTTQLCFSYTTISHSPILSFSGTPHRAEELGKCPKVRRTESSDVALHLECVAIAVSLAVFALTYIYKLHKKQ